MTPSGNSEIVKYYRIQNSKYNIRREIDEKILNKSCQGGADREVVVENDTSSSRDHLSKISS